MKTEIKILMLEDNHDDATLVERVLLKEKFSFKTLRVDTQQEFEDALDSFQPNIILSDHSLPQFSSMEALKICQQKNLNIPFILVTGTISEEYAVTCLNRGADDYVLKSNLSRLPLAIRHALRHRFHESAKKEYEETLFVRNIELTKINNELDSFVYSVSHNLRSPLASVLGLVHVATRDVDKTKEDVDEYFQMIKKSVVKLDDTLKEILDFSVNARTEIKVAEVNIKKLIGESLDQMKYLEGHEKTEVRVSIEIGQPFYSDVFRVSVILDNLISNALKYVDATKIKNFIHLKTIITPVEMIMTIHDNGIGIISECLKKVFTMFYRATERSEGAGLGLYIVKEMVDKLKGSISITSTANEETMITLTIPNFPRNHMMSRDQVV